MIRLMIHKNGPMSLMTCLAVVAMVPALALAGTKPARLVLTRGQCRALVRYHRAPGVGYRPGIDVNGNQVAPADLPEPGSAPAPDEIIVDLKRPLTQLTPAGTPASIAASNAHFGLVTIDPASGKVYLDGKPLDNPSEEALATACQRAETGGPKPQGSGRVN